MTALLGAPGSGKSTLLQHLNGLLRPDEGRVHVFGHEVGPGKPGGVPGKLRQKVGLVFQFPEQQLFESTVLKELLFAPLNHGLGKAEAKQAAMAAAEATGIVPLLHANPLELSSGQRRKVAIAAVMAADPDMLALDEPTASLDPASRAELMELLVGLCRERNKTVVVVTHRLEDVLGRADECAVLARGGLVFQGTLPELLGRPDVMELAGLSIPPVVRMARRLADLFGRAAPELASAAELAEWTAALLRERGRGGAE